MKKEKKVRFLNRMVFSYALVFTGILVAVMGLLYGVLINSSQEEARLNHAMLVNQPLKQLDQFVGEMDSVAYKVMTSEVLIKKFAVLREENDPENHYDRDVLDSIDTASILTGINSRLAPIWRISAYNDKGDFISSGAIVNRELVTDTLARPDAADTIAYFRASGKDFILEHPKRDNWSNYFKSEYFTFQRPIMNVYSRDVVGIVEVQQNRTVLEDYLRFSPDKPFTLNIYDDAGKPVMISGTAVDVIVATATSETYGWTIELLEPRSVREKEKVRLLGIMALITIALSGVVVLVISLIATRVAKPLTNLTVAVGRINAADPQRIHVAGTEIDEIAALEFAFNRMLDSLTLSMDQEKKSFLLAMQAQMNPHFLYNVLSVINAVALEGRSDKVVGICGSLSSMLRYSSSYVRGSATLREELEHTTAYLRLMKARYDYMFHYQVEMDEALADMVIPKLVIQPLCENCFTHAFSNTEPPYRLEIRVGTLPVGWSIRVTDNGAGFPEEVRQRVLERANLASYEDLSKMQIGGLGLVSSVVRLKLFTGKKIDCDIQRPATGGSAVIITITDSMAE